VSTIPSLNAHISPLQANTWVSVAQTTLALALVVGMTVEEVEAEEDVVTIVASMIETVITIDTIVGMTGIVTTVIRDVRHLVVTTLLAEGVTPRVVLVVQAQAQPAMDRKPMLPAGENSQVTGKLKNDGEDEDEDGLSKKKERNEEFGARFNCYKHLLSSSNSTTTIWCFPLSQIVLVNVKTTKSLQTYS